MTTLQQIRNLSLEEAKELMWGTYGIDGNDPLKFVTLNECETSHLHNIHKNILCRDTLTPQNMKYINAVELIIDSRQPKVLLDEDLFVVD